MGPARSPGLRRGGGGRVSLPAVPAAPAAPARLAELPRSVGRGPGLSAGSASGGQVTGPGAAAARHGRCRSPHPPVSRAGPGRAGGSWGGAGVGLWLRAGPGRARALGGRSRLRLLQRSGAGTPRDPRPRLAPLEPRCPRWVSPELRPSVCPRKRRPRGRRCPVLRCQQRRLGRDRRVRLWVCREVSAAGT